MAQQLEIDFGDPDCVAAEQVSHRAKGLQAVALHTVDGETRVYTGPISSITYARSTDKRVPWIVRADWDKPASALGSRLHAILLPGGRVHDAGCLWMEWPSLAAWKAHHKLAEADA